MSTLANLAKVIISCLSPEVQKGIFEEFANNTQDDASYALERIVNGARVDPETIPQDISQAVRAFRNEDTQHGLLSFFQSRLGQQVALKIQEFSDSQNQPSYEKPAETNPLVDSARSMAIAAFGMLPKDLQLQLLNEFNTNDPNSNSAVIESLIFANQPVDVTRLPSDIKSAIGYFDDNLKLQNSIMSFLYSPEGQDFVSSLTSPPATVDRKVTSEPRLELMAGANRAAPTGAPRTRVPVKGAPRTRVPVKRVRAPTTVSAVNEDPQLHAIRQLAVNAYKSLPANLKKQIDYVFRTNDKDSQSAVLEALVRNQLVDASTLPTSFESAIGYFSESPSLQKNLVDFFQSKQGLEWQASLAAPVDAAPADGTKSVASKFYSYMFPEKSKKPEELSGGRAPAVVIW